MPLSLIKKRKNDSCNLVEEGKDMNSFFEYKYSIIVLALTIAGVFLGSYLKHSDFLEKFFSN